MRKENLRQAQKRIGRNFALDRELKVCDGMWTLSGTL